MFAPPSPPSPSAPGRLAAWPDQVAFEIVERTVVQVLGTDHRSNRSLVIPTFAQFRTGTARTS